MGQRNRNSSRGAKSAGTASTSKVAFKKRVVHVHELVGVKQQSAVINFVQPGPEGTKAQKVPEGDACHHENTQIEAFWHTLSPQERTDMLTITLDEFWAKLLDKTNEGTVGAVQQRLLKTGSWMRYGWNSQAHLDDECFRLQVRERTKPHLLTLLREGGIGLKPSGQQLHNRMSALAKHLQEHKAANPPPDEQEAAKLPQWKKPVMTSLANLILRGLLKEHAHLYKAAIAPIIEHIERVLPEKERLSSILDVNGQMALEHRDLDLLPNAELQKVNHWLEGTVHEFGRAAGNNAGEAASWDVPPLLVSASKTTLTVNPEWLHQLQEATAVGGKSVKEQPNLSKKAHKGSKRGAQQAKSQGATDPALRWLCAMPCKEPPGPGLPWTAGQAFEQLQTALQETFQWVGRVDRVKELMSQIDSHRKLRSRVPYTPAKRQACTKDVNLTELNTISQQLRQEILLTDGKKHNTSYKCHVAQQRIVHLMHEGRQITASVNNVAIRLDALRELLPSSLGDVPLRSQLAGLGILSEVHVLYTRLEIHNQELEKNEEERDKAGEDEDKTQQEHNWLLQWSYTITSAYEALAKAANELVARDQVLVDSSKAVMIADGLPEGFVKQLPGAWVPIDQKLEAQQDVLRLMESFRDNLWPNLMTEKDEAKVYRALQAELEHLESIVSEGCAALPLLEAKLMSAACDDPSPLIMDWVVLPLLRQRLTAKTEQKAANKASGKQRGSVEKKQDESTPEVTSPSTSSQDSATSTVTPASLQPHTPEAALAAAAAADNAVAAGMKARTFTGQERYGEAAYAEMAAEMLSQQASNLRAHPGGKVPQKDICLAINEDYAAQYEQLLAEEAARAAAESPESSPPPPRPADSACQVAGLNTTAAGCAPAGMAEGTKEKAASLLKGKPDQADAARQSAQEPTCAVYPDDFMVRCVSAAQAAAVTRMCPIRTVQLDDKGAEVTEPADPTAALVNCHSLLHQYIRCPLSQRILVAAVVAQDGFAYNGWIIEPWLERYGTSPRTGTPLADTCLPAVPIRCLVYQQTWSLIGV